MSRPKKKIKKTQSITVRYSMTDKRKVEGYAKRCGLRPAEFVHQKSLGYKVRSRLSRDEVDVYRQMIGVANNLNQLTKLANSRQLLTNEILKVLHEINQVLNKLQ